MEARALTDAAVRIHIPEGVSNDDVFEALQEVQVELSKALKRPLPTVTRARARKAFLALQKNFRFEMHAIFSGMDDIAQTARHIIAEGVTREQKRRMEGLLQRQHRRYIAQLNASFKRTYTAAFGLGLAAAGAQRGLSPEGEFALERNEAMILRDLRVNENAYAGNFLTDVANNEGTMDYQKRTDLYANALEEAYWQGYLYGDLSADRFVQWRLYHGGWQPGTETENCIDCALLSGDLTGLSDAEREIVEGSGRPIGGRWGNGIYQARELARMGIAPQSGKLACTTKCHCRLVPAKRPDRDPIQAGYKGAFTSLRKKEFTGTERDEEGRRFVTRQAQHRRRKDYARRADRTEHRHRIRIR